MQTPKLLLVAVLLLATTAILVTCKVKAPPLSDVPSYFPDVQLPADTTKNVFADFMWQMFIALNQPEAGGEIPTSNDYRTLWETFATSHNLFGSGKEGNGATVDLKNENTLIIPNYIQASDSGDFHHNSPLVDLDHQYTWAGLRYNDVFTDYTLKYNLNNLTAVKKAFHTGSGTAGEVIEWLPGKHTFPNFPKGVSVAKFEFPDYSIMLKPGWKILTSRDNAADFFLARPKPEYIYENNNYNNLKKALAERQLVDTTNCDLTSKVVLLDEYNRGIYNERPPGTKIDTFQSNGAEAGLVAYHLVVKMPNHPLWIWATFEQVNNGPMEGDVSNYGKDWTFFDDANGSKQHNAWPELTSGVKDDIPELNPDSTDLKLYKFQWFDPNLKNQLPTQVTRVDPIDPIVAAINTEYQQKYANTIWHNYKLIDVQWVREDPNKVQKTYPPYIANIALETYIQATSSCMGCHALVADVNRDKKDSTDYLLTTPSLYHLVIPNLVSSGGDSILVGDFSYGFSELFGLDITTNQVDLDSLPVAIPAVCTAN